MTEVIASIRVINSSISSINQELKTAQIGFSEINQALNGSKGVIHTVQDMTSSIQIANTGVQEMLAGQSKMAQAFTKMNAGSLLVNDSLSSQITAISEANTALSEMTESNASNMAALDKFNSEMHNLNVGAIEYAAASTYSPSSTTSSTTGFQNAISSLSNLFNANSNQFVVFPISDATKQKFEQSMNTSAQLLNALSFFTHGTVEVVGGAAAGITGIAGVMSGGALVTLDTGGVGILALPGTVVLAGGAIVAASGATIASGLADISQGIQVAQFHNGDRPESRTYGQVQGKYNGKNVTYRVDAEPQGKKLQVQINGNKSFDARLNADEIHSIQDAINKMPDKLVKNLTSGNLQTLAKYIYKAAQSLNS
ncbi:hypothetical protein [Lactiplantibacillus mudanjiangensis]|uniref:hypothetical protein n=1 Tax=Lactiplantibacillus mudanjiangensis TaxID=1296538 RepID=UPI00103174C9|nr:hypothetical protein [Lactiplantibacillus mudanjiangensis]